MLFESNYNGYNGNNGNNDNNGNNGNTVRASKNNLRMMKFS